MPTWASRSPGRHAPTPEELASVAARQFVPMPEVPAGPRAMTIEGDPSHGPFGAFAQSATQPLDPNWRGDTWGYWGTASRRGTGRASPIPRAALA
ncbi:MAG TPA: hypothetical protein VM820_03275 [Vicinamibacterales bacterium]|nr:hypothetical protein [Vicinamibacterales bacterium]